MKKIVTTFVIVVVGLVRIQYISDKGRILRPQMSSKLPPLGQIGPIARAYVNNILMKYSLTHSFVYHLWLGWHYKNRVQ